MRYKTVLCALLCAVTFLPSVLVVADEAKTTQTDIQSQIAALDSQIKQLKDKRDVAAMRAYEAQDTADQVMDEDWMGYEEAESEQAEFQQEAQDLDAQIASLEKQKALLSQKLQK